MQSNKPGVIVSQPPSALRRRLLGLAAFTLFACGLLALIGASGYIGARSGTVDFVAHSTATASQHIVEWFQHGLDSLRQGNYPLAEANFEAVLREQPGNVGVQDLIATARVAQTPTSLPPTATPTPVITDKAELLAHIQSAYDRQDWNTVVNLCSQLAQLDGEYQHNVVDDLLYQALVARGKARLKGGDIEAGLYDLDLASGMRKLDSQTESQRQMAAMYQNALYYIGADWAKAIELLTQIYQISPGYRDVAARLFAAYVSSGDAYATFQNWCPAEAQYAGAVKISADGRINQKRVDAQQRCLSATPIGLTTTVAISGNGLGLSGVTGRIIFAGDLGNGSNILYAFGGGAANPIEVSGSQPSYQSRAGIVAYTLGGTIHGLYSNGTLGAIGHGGGAWPSVSPDGSRVAYAALQDGNWTVYVMPVNGSSAPVRIAQGSYPVWGPTGRIAFQACVNNECGIHLVDPDHPADIQRLTTTAGDISMQWSPDGSQLVYMTNFTGNWEIYAVSLSRQFRQLTNGGGLTAAPAWSPDGSMIAYESNRDGTWGIYVMSSSGGEARKVLSLGANLAQWQTERLAWVP